MNNDRHEQHHIEQEGRVNNLSSGAETDEKHEKHEKHENEPQPPHPRIYVASLSDYNNGILHGDWIDAELEPEQMYAKTREMLSRSPANRRYGDIAEEWAIHDSEGFGSLHLSEHQDFTSISRLARGIIDHGPAFAAWAEYVGQHNDQLDDFEDHYFGEWSSVREYAEHVLDDLGYLDEVEKVVPDYLKPYVALDTSAFSRDLILSGDIFAHETDDGRVWVFDGR